jgi:signal transduction histidine kinase
MSGWATFAPGAAIGVLVTWLVALRAETNRRRALSGPLHELRGALAVIQLGLFSLERRGGVSVVANRLDALRMQAERAHVAVEDVDDIRLARRSAANRLELVEAGAVVRRRVAAWSGLAETRRRAVELRWPIESAVVRADVNRIGQALDNLIVNALDHGCGVVRVMGSLTGPTVRIVVADQGPGIARPLRELVMDSPWHGRHGHGLAVAARVAELHGGRLTASSGRTGSRIEIELPLAEPVPEQVIGRPRIGPRSVMRLDPASGGRS